MTTFAKKLNNLFNAITSKENFKPDVYGYELEEFEIIRDSYGNINFYNGIWESGAHFLSNEVFTTFIDAANFLCDGGFDEEYETEKEFKNTGDRYDLFEITDDMLSDVFDVESKEDFIELLLDEDDAYHADKTPSDSDSDEFYHFGEYLFAVTDDGKLLFGKESGSLEPFTFNDYEENE